MITKNYHTHTARCRHASGSDRDFVLAAIENGYKEIGFSDHAPMLFDMDDYYSSFRMYPYEAAGYIDSIRKLKAEFREKINILVGFELEYYPKLFARELNFLKSLDIDYLILGQHCTLNEYENGSVYCGQKVSSVKVLDDYINQSVDGLKTGRFSYLAHPDMINFTGDMDVYKERMYFLCAEAKRLGYPIEFNILGFVDGRNYPNDIFWKIAAEVKNNVVIGIDAHNPNAYYDRDSLISAQEYLKQLGLTANNNIELIKP